MLIAYELKKEEKRNKKIKAKSIDKQNTQWYIHFTRQVKNKK